MALPYVPHKTNEEDIGEVIKKEAVKKKSFQFVISNFRTAHFGILDLMSRIRESMLSLMNQNCRFSSPSLNVFYKTIT